MSLSIKTVTAVSKKIGHSKHLEMLNQARIDGGTMMMTDLDNWVRLSVAAAPGMLDREKMQKTGSLENSMSSADPVDFPNEPEPAGLQTFADCAIFNCVDFASYIPYTESNKSRSCLCNINHDTEAGMLWATDGHKAKYIYTADMPLPVSFSMPTKAAEILEILKKQAGPVVDCGTFQPEASDTGIKHKYFYAAGAEYRLTWKQDSGPLAQIKKAIPEYKPEYCLAFEPGQISHLAAAVSEMNKYANEKTHMVILDRETILVRNDQNGYKATLPFPFMPEIVENHKSGSEYPYCRVGFNAEYLAMVFKALKDQPITICFPGAALSAHLFKSGTENYILMPLRVIEDLDSDEPDTVYAAMEYKPIDCPAPEAKAAVRKARRPAAVCECNGNGEGFLPEWSYCPYCGKTIQHVPAIA